MYIVENKSLKLH